MLLQQTEQLPHTPSSVVAIFYNVLNSYATRKLFKIKGIYQPGKGQSYNGFYYDILKDEGSDAYITLIVPAIIRASLTPQKTIECIVYMTKRVQAKGAKIELLVNLVEVVSEQERKYTDDQIKDFEILQRKAEQGYKDGDSFIKTRVINSTPINIVILIGKTGIIDSDIKHQMKEAVSFYSFQFIRISLGSPSEIITAMQEHEKTADILILSRGGGDNLEIFENPAIAEVSLSLKCIFLTAIGHKENIPLLQKVADKAFITPTALGQYLNDIYNETIEQLQNSKAKLIDDISRQFKANYDKQIQTLNEKLKATEEVNERAKNDIRKK